MNRSIVRIVRLKNGETLISGILPSTDENFHIMEHPMEITSIPVVGKKGIESVNIFMQDWMEYSSDTVFKIPNDIILVNSTPDEEMLDEYFSALKKNELHRIQKDFENISKNYEYKTDKPLDSKDKAGYNKSNEPYEEEEYDDELDEDDTDEDD